MIQSALEWLLLPLLATAGAPDRHDAWHLLAEAAAPLAHGIVAAGSDHCEYLKKILGLSYEQIQAKNSPDTETNLSIKLITRTGTQNFTMTDGKSIPRHPDYDPKKQLVILIHGFMEDSEGMMVQTIAQEFMERPGYNVMALNGGEMIKMLYFRSSTYVRFMGEKLGEVLAELVKEGQTPEDITIIGHSLGAHIAGISGKEFSRLTGARLGRITGLDPAGPCFSNVEDGARLMRGDALYVDVIHTDGGLLGVKEPVGDHNRPDVCSGDQDYFPNGGSTQPGCVLPPCCHSRAWQLYAQSINNPEAFPARLCPDWTAYKSGSCASAALSYMGASSAPGDVGSYFLSTGPGADGARAGRVS